jgi:hypothetical protein
MSAVAGDPSQLSLTDVSGTQDLRHLLGLRPERSRRRWGNPTASSAFAAPSTGTYTVVASASYGNSLRLPALLQARTVTLRHGICMPPLGFAYFATRTTVDAPAFGPAAKYTYCSST